MLTTNISNFRKNIFEYVDKTMDLNVPITIVTKKGNAVMLSQEEYDSMVETLYINSVPGLADSILEASAEPRGNRVTLNTNSLEEFMEEIEALGDE